MCPIIERPGDHKKMLIKLANLQPGMTWKKNKARANKLSAYSQYSTLASYGPGPGSKQLAADPDLQPGQDLKA